MNPLPFPKRCRRAFTLVELLVAVAVLAMLVVLVAALVQGGNALIASSRRHLDADAQAREVFARFEADLGGIPRRADLDVLLSNRNDALFFFSQAPGAFASSKTADHNSLALVGYRVNARGELERLGKGLSWEGVPHLTYPTNTPSASVSPLRESTIAGAWSATVGAAPSYRDGTDDDYHLLADGVFRLFFCFRKADGSNALALGSNPLQWRLQDASAIVLTLAILDSGSRAGVRDAAAMGDALPFPADGMPPGKLWREAVRDAPRFAAAAGIPQAAAARVRIYQRSFLLASP